MEHRGGIIWVETLPDAVDFIRDTFGIPEMLDSEASRAYRTLWRERFLPPKRRTLHRCWSCKGKPHRKHYLDWDSLFTSPQVRLRELTSDAEIVECLADKASPITPSRLRCFLSVATCPCSFYQSRR